MKTSALLLAAAASIAAAQSIDDLVAQIPECVLPCIRDGAQEAGCAEGDRKCECDNIESIAGSVAICLIGLPEDQQCQDDQALEDATKLTAQICALVAAGAGDSTATPTETGAADETATTTTTTATTTDADAEDDSDSDDGADSTATDDESTPTETPDAANKASFAWAGVAAAVAAMAL